MRSALLALVACSSAHGDPAAKRSPQGPLVLELFTSQGCSSCPAADALLGKLAREPGDRPLAPLAFHVDYWNGLGWADPFSSAAWTDRQRAYSDALGDASVYTPELVVGGAAGLIGSSRDRVTRAIAAAPPVELLSATATWRADALDVRVTAPAGTAVLVALWEDGTRTAIPRGENAGETLVGDRVVRRLVQVDGAATIPIDRTWQHVGAVAFAQRPDRRIVAAALLPR